MNVNELRAEKKHLERCLQQEIDSLISSFTAKTGFSPESITIDMIESTRVGSPEREYRLDSVSVDISL